MEWIHCNNCCCQPHGKEHNDFIMTTCGHIFCKRCESRDNIDSCMVCGEKCRAAPIAGPLKPQIKLFFSDVENTLNTLSKVAKFQKNHCVNLYKKQQRKIESSEQLKIENGLLRKKLEEAKKEIQFFRNESGKYLPQGTPSAKLNSIELRPPRSNHSSVADSFNSSRTPGQKDMFGNTRRGSEFQHIPSSNTRKYNDYRTRKPSGYDSSSMRSNSTGFANSFCRQVASSTFGRMRETPHARTPSLSQKMRNGPTPPYNALQGMNIDDFRPMKS